MPKYLSELNESQHLAVTAPDGPMLVVAGPGSGKTRVLTYRIAWLMEQGVPARDILTLTFTNKSAREMKERIESVVGQDARQLWAGTFHSVFARILRAEAAKIGYPSSFSIYDSEDTSSLLRSIIKEMQLDPGTYSASAIRSRISLAKSSLITPIDYRNNAEMMAQDRQSRRPYLVDIYEKYTLRCKRAGAMDFDDLLFQLYRLLRSNPDNVRDKYQKKFRYIHVDEFQDTNFLQYAILRNLLKYEGSPENIFAVGDDAQSIYAFRGATIDNILGFEHDFPTLRTYKLEQNYRSTQHIVAAANQVIAFNKRQLPKTIWTDKTSAQKIRLLRTATDDEEARRVADIILEQKHRHHLPNAEFAILYRTNAQSRKFEESLRRLNLQYRVFGGLSFYQRKEVKDFVAYLRLAVNPADEEALKRTINYPTRGISAATIEKLLASAASNQTTLWDALSDPTLPVTDRARKSLDAFRTLIGGWMARAYADDAVLLAKDILRQSQLQQALESDTSHEGTERWNNVKAVVDAISEFADQEVPEAPDRSLSAYLQTITLLTDADESAEQVDYITLMSVHSAKGLEYKSVFVTGLEEDLFPSFMSREDPNGLDEERRLFYVAITRAKEFLTLTFAQNRYRFGKMIFSMPSRFLEEISREHVDISGGIGNRTPSTGSTTPPKSGVQGRFGPSRHAASTIPGVVVDASGFVPSPGEAIVSGARVRHLKFGDGAVVGVDGPKENRVAAIQFDAEPGTERRIVLKFAKLMVLA
jgi:DNA helicase-2/ATP-dependent DNA helicase PcrA